VHQSRLSHVALAFSIACHDGDWDSHADLTICTYHDVDCEANWITCSIQFKATCSLNKVIDLLD
jgi:hypothetical protein